MSAKKRRRRRTNYAGFLIFMVAAAIGVLAFAVFKPAPQTRDARNATLPTPQPAPSQSPKPESTEIPSATATATSTSAPQTSAPGGMHRLAIIIDDCGQWPRTERAFIALAIPLTLSVMPKERYTQTIAQEAAAAGKGVMMHLPMEPVSQADPGPGKITTTMSDAQIVAQVREDIARVPLAKGVNNHEGSKASADPRVMRDVVSVLAPSGLFFIDSRTSAESVAASVAAQAGMPTASRDVFLDNVDTVEAVEGMLRHAADVALANGSAVAIGHPRGATLRAVQELIPELQARGIDFALASELVRAP